MFAGGKKYRMENRRQRRGDDGSYGLITDGGEILHTNEASGITQDLKVIPEQENLYFSTTE
jgi:hypothetical protein